MARDNFQHLFRPPQPQPQANGANGANGAIGAIEAHQPPKQPNSRKTTSTTSKLTTGTAAISTHGGKRSISNDNGYGSSQSSSQSNQSNHSSRSSVLCHVGGTHECSSELLSVLRTASTATSTPVNAAGTTRNGNETATGKAKTQQMPNESRAITAANGNDNAPPEASKENYNETRISQVPSTETNTTISRSSTSSSSEEQEPHEPQSHAPQQNHSSSQDLLVDFPQRQSLQHSHQSRQSPQSQQSHPLPSSSHKSNEPNPHNPLNPQNFHPNKTRPGTESMQFFNSRLKTIGSQLGSQVGSTVGTIGTQFGTQFGSFAERFNAMNSTNSTNSEKEISEERRERRLSETDRLRRQLEEMDRLQREQGLRHGEEVGVGVGVGEGKQKREGERERGMSDGELCVQDDRKGENKERIGSDAASDEHKVHPVANSRPHVQFSEPDFLLSSQSQATTVATERAGQTPTQTKPSHHPIEMNETQSSQSSQPFPPSPPSQPSQTSQPFQLDDEQIAIRLQKQEAEQAELAELERMKLQSNEACRRISRRYEALERFVTSNPTGSYEDFIEFLLLGGLNGSGLNGSNGSGGSNDSKGTETNQSNHGNAGETSGVENAGDGGDDDLLYENFYAKDSEFRMLWNDNLKLGLCPSSNANSGADFSSVEGRAFVPALGGDINDINESGDSVGQVEQVARKAPSLSWSDIDPWHRFFDKHAQSTHDVNASNTSNTSNASTTSNASLESPRPRTRSEDRVKHFFSHFQSPERPQTNAQIATHGDGVANVSDPATIPRIPRERTHSDGENIKKQVGSALNFTRDATAHAVTAITALSNVSSLALKPLRDLQLAEKLNAMNLDMEEAEAQREMQREMQRVELERERERRKLEYEREMEEMMQMKKEAEEICMRETRDHLLEFIRERPNATYQEWIEDLHPENAHDGKLLEGLGKTIDHRFFVEESDHRKLWNENLLTFVDPNSTNLEEGTKGGRQYVPARARQMYDNGEMVVAADLLSGSAVGVDGGDGGDGGGRGDANDLEVERSSSREVVIDCIGAALFPKKSSALDDGDLIAFD